MKKNAKEELRFILDLSGNSMVRLFRWFWVRFENTRPRSARNRTARTNLYLRNYQFFYRVSFAVLFFEKNRSFEMNFVWAEKSSVPRDSYFFNFESKRTDKKYRKRFNPFLEASFLESTPQRRIVTIRIFPRCTIYVLARSISRIWKFYALQEALITTYCTFATFTRSIGIEVFSVEISVMILRRWSSFRFVR